jgi:hypothetical protein
LFHRNRNIYKEVIALKYIMEDMYKMGEEKNENEVLYSKVIPKFTSDGTRQVGSLKVEVKLFNDNKFVQLSQRKEAFGRPGSADYKPAKDTWVTINPEDKSVKDALMEAFKI